jgi:hypothetical protein
MDQAHPGTLETTWQRRWTMGLATLAFACIPLLADEARAREAVPSVPPGLEVGPGHRLFLVGHAAGTQNYICLPNADSPSGVAWTFIGPQATLFPAHGVQLATHFLSPNPDEGGTPRATWQHSRDSSAVWAVAIASSTDPGFVEPGAVPWLLLAVKGTEPGTVGRGTLTDTVSIQRIHTSGGVAPATGCDAAEHVGHRALVPYAADYLFYEPAGRP